MESFSAKYLLFFRNKATPLLGAAIMSRAMRNLCMSITLLLTVGCFLLSRATVVAQEKPNTPPKTTEPTEKEPDNSSGIGEIQEVKPEVYIVLDEDGKVVRFIKSLTYEKLRKLFEGTAENPPPRYKLKSSSITGSVTDNHADLKVILDIELLVSDLVQVPLRLNNVYLRKTSYQGTGKQFIHYEQETGHACWIRDEKGTKHKIELEVVAPVQKSGDISRLSFVLPLDGQVKISLPVDRVEVVELKNATLRSTKPLGKNRTELELFGNGNVQLAWRRAKAPGKKPATVLTSSGAIRVTFEGQRHISSDARLKVRSLTGPIDSFVVRLPKGMKHVPLQQSSGPRQYGVYVLSKNEKEQRKIDARYANDELVEVRLASKTSEPVEINLRGRLAINDAGTAAPLGSPVETAGFEILQAEQRLQWGTIDIAVEGDWSLRWEDEQVTRVGDILDTLRQDGIVARFEYSQQPCSLKVRVLPKTTRVTIEPLYLVKVSATEARLEARLKYKLSGARTFPLKIDLAGWKLDEILPKNLAPSQDGNSPNQSLLTISLPPTLNGETELQILAHREIPAGSEKLSFELPRPQSNSLSPATLVIAPEDNIDLHPIEEELKGLVIESTPPTLNLPESQQPRLYYQKQADIDSPSFVGQFQIQPRSVLVEVDSLAKVDPRTAQIEQHFNYHIAYEPLTNLELDVPLTALESNSVKVTLNDKILPVTVLEQEETDTETSAAPPLRQRLRIDLPAEQRLGEVELVVRYELRLPELKLEEKVTLNVPLVMPWLNDETTVLNNTLLVTASDKLEVKAIENEGDGGWKFLEKNVEAASAPRISQLTADGAIGEVPLQMTLVPSSESRSTVVRQAWVQTWLTNNLRRDRAVFQFSTGDNRVQVLLPPGIKSDDIELALNGHRVTDFTLNDAKDLSLNLPNNAIQKQHVLELWYSFSDERSEPGLVTLQAAQIVGASWTKRWYWQLVLPKDEHLLVTPDQLTSELMWRWQGVYWGRRSTLEQHDLEQWIGASRQAALPEATNQYLFSSFGAVEQVHLYTAPRRYILLAASFIALVAGLLLIYFPTLRNPGVLFFASVCLLAIGFYYPEPTLQITQAASVGIVLVMVARLVDWSISHRYASHSVVRGTSLTHVEVSPSDSQIPRPPNVSQISTATAPHVAIAPPSDSQS